MQENFRYFRLGLGLMNGSASFFLRIGGGRTPLPDFGVILGGGYGHVSTSSVSSLYRVTSQRTSFELWSDRVPLGVLLLLRETFAGPSRDGLTRS